MNWKNVIQSPKTSIGALMALVGIGLCIAKQSDAGIALIGASTAWVGFNSKDADKQ